MTTEVDENEKIETVDLDVERVDCVGSISCLNVTYLFPVFAHSIGVLCEQ